MNIDLHTHSILSHDGGIREKDYCNALKHGILDCIAITDHNTIDFALSCQKKLGKKIIIGEEITTNEGHLIGLFLAEVIPAYQSIAETITQIKEQNGLVYVPHPFDIMREGIGETLLQIHQSDIDIVEVFNARVVWRNQNARAKKYAQNYNIRGASSSDAHSEKGLGYAYSKIRGPIEKNTLVTMLKNASYYKTYLPYWHYMMPKLNRLHKLLHHEKDSLSH
ncbi:MAG TPA: PHP domain-containing protein [Patescibacteria group bacterium]|nr:PHP domain-containing protein [Patescibacteria group bacterium]